jgi:hypothetical protein
MARKSQQKKKVIIVQPRKKTYASCPNSPQRKKKTTRRGRKGKFTASASYEGFGLKGQFALSKQSAPAAIGVSGVVRAPVTRSVAGGEAISGSSLMFMAPTTDCSVSFDIQPGLSNLFPQLAPTARLFSKYRFRNLEFVWVTRCGSGTPGQVTMAFNPDVQTAPPLNFTEATSYEGTAFGAVWNTRVVMRPRAQQQLYVRTGPIPAGADPKTFDMGKLTLLLDDLPTDLPPTGFLQCNYDVEFTDRVLIPPSGCEIMPEYKQDPVTGSRNFFQDFFTLAPVINPLAMIYMDPDQPDNAGVGWIGLPAGYWVWSFSYSADAGIATNVTPWYPFGNSPENGGLIPEAEGTVYAVPPSQWTRSGIITGSATTPAVTNPMYLIYNPTSAIGTPDIAPAGWFSFQTQEDGYGNVARSVSSMLCFFPTVQSLAAEFPGFNPAVIPRPIGFSHRTAHHRRTARPTCSSSSDPNRLMDYKRLDHTPIPPQMVKKLWSLYFAFTELSAKHDNICSTQGYRSIDEWLEIRSELEVLHTQFKGLRDTALRIDPTAYLPPTPALLTRVQERRVHLFFEDDLPDIEECDKNKTGKTCK